MELVVVRKCHFDAEQFGWCKRLTLDLLHARLLIQRYDSPATVELVDMRPSETKITIQADSRIEAGLGTCFWECHRHLAYNIKETNLCGNYPYLERHLR